MGRVVQKYGGSSVADAESIKRVAKRIVATKQQGQRRRRRHLGDGRHHRRADGPRPPGVPDAAAARAGHAADRGRADERRPAGHGDRRPGAARPLADRVAGRHHHHRHARQRPDHRHHARPDHHAPWTRATSSSSPASRASRRTPRTSPRWAAERPTRRRSRWRPHWAPTTARSTPTSTACSPPTRGSCRAPGGSRGSRTRRCWRWPPAGPRSCICAAWSTRGARTCRCTSGRRSRTRTAPGSKSWRKEAQMEQAIISGVAHDRGEAKITIVGVPDRVGEAARIFEAVAATEINIDMIVQNVSAVETGRTDISFTLPKTDGQAAMATLRRAPGSPSASPTSSTTTRSARSRWSASGCARTPGVTAKFFSALAAAGRQHRDDLHLGDPDLGRGRPGRRGPGRASPPTPPSAWTRPKRPWSTPAPAADSRRR